MTALRRLSFAALVVVALAVLVRVVLDPVAAYETRQALGRLHGLRGEFANVHVTLLPPTYTIARLALWRSPGDRRDEPLFLVESARVAVVPLELFHRRVVAGVRLERPKVSVIQRHAAPAKGPPAPPDVSVQLGEALPFRLDRLDVIDGEVLFRDDTAPLRPEVWVHHLELAAENVASRGPLEGGRPARVTARGTVGKTGRLELFVTADPLASPLAFAGRLSLRDFAAAELYAFLEPKEHLQASRGTIDTFAQWISKAGRLRGGVKAVLENVALHPTTDDLWDRLRAWLGDKSIELASDRVPGRNAVATTVPITGNLTHPDVQLWPAVLGVVRNAFIAALASGFSNVPPPTAPAPESKLAQAARALKKGAGPPKAQPPPSPASPAPTRPAIPTPTPKGH